jgi:predicted nucleic-acid-binding protein
MIAVDTNVLLRYLLQDDALQSRKAASLMTGSRPVLITDVVLVETLWVLTGKRYRLDHEGVAGVISALFAEPSVVFENAQAIWRALNDYRNTQAVKVSGKKKRADFADALIVNKARLKAASFQQSLEGIYTFDVAALEIPGTLSP